MASEIGLKARIPNPQLKPLEPIIGEWTTTGTHPFFPGLTVHGRTSLAWQDNGAFLVWRSELDHPKFPAGIAIFGSDDEAGIVFISYVDEREISRRYDIEITADGFVMSRSNPKFSQRMTFKLEPGGQRMTAKGEMSRDVGAWEGDLSLTYDRVSS